MQHVTSKLTQTVLLSCQIEVEWQYRNNACFLTVFNIKPHGWLFRR